MEPERRAELIENLDRLSGTLAGARIFLFGHAHATEELADELIARGYSVAAILDNSKEKHGKNYRDLPIVPPEEILKYSGESTIVCIVSRFYESMAAQLKKLGYTGAVEKLVDYNTFAEYSVSEDTIARKLAREQHGEELTRAIRSRHPNAFLVFCPLNALGDVYLTMSYLPAFMEKLGRPLETACVCVPGNACAAVVRLFGGVSVEVLPQRELEAVIQAAIYTEDPDVYIAHQDRPYVVKLHRALYLKRISLELIYRCGIFGLPQETAPCEPVCWEEWPELDRIDAGKAVILSPYAKSVTALPVTLWEKIVKDLKGQGLQLWTNVAGDEKALAGTEPLSAKISELRSVLERAGTFIGLRSGLCDVIRTADCRKIALYPDYYYSDTKWKSIEMYAIDGFANLEVREGSTWEDLKQRAFEGR